MNTNIYKNSDYISCHTESRDWDYSDWQFYINPIGIYYTVTRTQDWYTSTSSDLIKTADELEKLRGQVPDEVMNELEYGLKNPPDIQEIPSKYYAFFLRYKTNGEHTVLLGVKKTNYPDFYADGKYLELQTDFESENGIKTHLYFEEVDYKEYANLLYTYYEWIEFPKKPVDESIEKLAKNTLEICNSLNPEPPEVWLRMTPKEIIDVLKEYNSCLEKPMRNLEDRAEALYAYVNEYFRD